MIHLPPEPAPGDKVSANAFRQLIRIVKSLRPIAGTGVRLGCGPNGTVINAGSPVRGKTAAQVSHGCFDLEFVKEEEEDSGDSGGSGGDANASGDSGGDSGSDTSGEPVPKLVRQYYRIGHRLYNLDDASALDPELGAFIALKVSNVTDDSITGAEIAQYEDWDTMAEESADVDAAIIPLYELKLTEDDNGQQKISGVAVDFRSMPVFVMAEPEEEAS